MPDLNVKVGLDRSVFQTGLAAMENSVQKFGMRVTGALAAAVGVGAFVAATKQSIELADRLDDLSKRFGVSASKLQLLGNVAGQEGTDIEALGQSLKFLGKNAQLAADAPSGEIAQAFAAIGVTGQQLRSLKPDELFLRLADSFSSGSLAGQEFAVSSKLLGRGFEQVIPLLRMGREEIEKIGTSKGIFTDQQIQQLAKVEDFLQKINNLKKVAVGETTFSFIKSFKDFLSAGAPGSVARALRENLFGEDKSPASRRSGGASLRAPIMDRIDEERIKELQKQDTDEARFELKIIEARIQGRESAQKILEQYEDKAAEDQIRKAEERGRATAEAISRIEDIQAERGGPQAQQDLLRKRAQEAIATANRTMSTQDILAAEQARQQFEQFSRQQIESSDYYRVFGGDAAAQARSMGDKLGSIPGLSAGLSDTASAGGMKQSEGPKETTVLEIKREMEKAVNKLDELIRASGTFSL